MIKVPPLEDRLPQNDFEKPWAPLGMRCFTVWRGSDESGVSGTGVVAQGVLFANGDATIQWRCPPAPGDVQTKKFDSWLDVHVVSHNNYTIVTWENGKEDIYNAPEPPEKEETSSLEQNKEKQS